VKRQAAQDYLKATYLLSETLGRVSTSALSEYLGVKPSSVTSMIKKLNAERPRLLDYESHFGVTLTKAGRQIALNMTRRHRLIEQFLVAVLGFTWDEVHEEADQLEHCVSDKFVDRLDKLLLHPTRDPHGHPIPTKDGEVHEVNEYPLSDAAADSMVRVSSVGSQDVLFLQYLTKIGLVPDAALRVVETLTAGGVMRIETMNDAGNIQHVIGSTIAAQVYVSPIP
jgi:DtxR family Mn-dependent transcriptional regulator